MLSCRRDKLIDGVFRRKHGQDSRSAVTTPGIYEKLNTCCHARALQVFMVILLAHWGEHLFQAYHGYRQQMRWNRWTVQPFLDVRTAVLNN